jgi:hypothetical protein
VARARDRLLHHLDRAGVLRGGLAAIVRAHAIPDRPGRDAPERRRLTPRSLPPKFRGLLVERRILLTLVAWIP